MVGYNSIPDSIDEKSLCHSSLSREYQLVDALRYMVRLAEREGRWHRVPGRTKEKIDRLVNPGIAGE